MTTLEVQIHAPVAKVFQHVDDIEKMGRHMTRSSMPMMGTAMHVHRTSSRAKGVGTTYHWTGNVMGWTLDFSETVIRWVQNKEKVWRTIGSPKIIIMGGYEMSFKVRASGGGTKLTYGISYDLPKPLLMRLLGRLLAPWYCRWCLKNMATDAKLALEKAR